MWKKLLTSLANLLSKIGQSVFPFYAETWVGTSQLLFSLLPVVWNYLDIDGDKNADLRIRLVPTLALPPDGVIVTIERWGTTVLTDVSAIVFIGIKDIPPADMQLAFFGYLGEQGKIAPEKLNIFLEQKSVSTNTVVTARLGVTNAQDLVRVRAGFMTSSVSPHSAIDPRSNTPIQIRTGDLTTAPEKVDVTLSVSIPSGVSSDPLLEVKVTAPTIGSGTLQATYSAPQVLKLAAYATTKSQGKESHMFLRTNRMPSSLTLTLTDIDAVIQPNEALTIDVGGIGLPLPPELGFTSARAQVELPGLPMRVAWKPPPLVFEVGPTPDTKGQFKMRLNARLLPGQQSIASLDPLPQPLQALVAEYLEGQQLWAAIDGLEGARVTMEKAGTSTHVTVSLTMTDPLTNLSPRSVRLFASMTDSADPEPKRLNYDVRASEFLADSARGSGTISGDVRLVTALGDPKKVILVNATVVGPLRHLRALYEGSGSRIEAWIPLTSPQLDLTYGDEIEPMSMTFRPSAVMAIGADYRAVGEDTLLGPYARVFARLLFDGVINAHYGMVPRQPEIRGTAADGSTPFLLIDAQTTAFPPEVVGMSLRYEGGTNQGQTRTIRAVGMGRLETSEPFPNPPSASDPFVVVATDLLFDVMQPLHEPSPRQGLSAAVSLGGIADVRLATRMNPQVRQVSSHTWVPSVANLGPGVPRADAARIVGLRRVQLHPPVAAGQGWLRADIELDPGRAARSLRFAQDQRWFLPDAIRESIETGTPSTVRRRPVTRVLLADAPDLISIQGPTPLLLTRVGGAKPRVVPEEKQGWVWMELLQQRRTGALAGLGILSLDLAAIPEQLSVIIGKDLSEAKRTTIPIGATTGDVMPTPASWLISSQAVTVSKDLHIERVVFASFWPGGAPLSPLVSAIWSGDDTSYPTIHRDEWSLITVPFVHLHDAGAANQRFTVWQLEEKKFGDPDRGAGIGFEASGLSADLDLDRYRALLTRGLQGYWNIPWEKKVEIQLQAYTGAWLLDGISSTPTYNAVEMGFWFLRAIDKIRGIGDAYFGNTAGTINGRTRPWGP